MLSASISFLMNIIYNFSLLPILTPPTPIYKPSIEFRIKHRTYLHEIYWVDYVTDRVHIFKITFEIQILCDPNTFYH